uniref:Baseplate assembly protein n=1 Tax=Desertifilum tharense IPPAS B-1220 TaxID=1781255 RepID=A0ACD5GYE7_9CYAN
MEFDFLPNLPKSNLDDRTFKDLVDECILRIPRYCPEWTNYNASDPGITLIELFAWLTDQMLLRFNQVPRRNYIAFLEVLGVRLQAPTPAQTDITFYLTTTLPEPYTIPLGVEVATLRTQTDEAIVFSTDAPLTISHPSLRHFLTAQTVENEPQALRDRITGLWTQRSNGEWTGRELSLFNEQPEPGNCFYLVFNPEEQIEGNVLAVTFKGEAATPTGINPDAPPRRWEAWNGTTWQPVLIQESDDGTKGFSFSEIAQQGETLYRVPISYYICPPAGTVAHFTTYQGRWLRCVYTIPQTNQPGYNSSPRIISLAVRSVGGTVGASQSSLIQNELLGESDGTPGQSFQLQGFPILPRREGEYLIVTPPGGLPQAWQEVSDFASSTAEDLHYTLDSRTGIIQFSYFNSRTLATGATNLGTLSQNRRYHPYPGVTLRFPKPATVRSYPSESAARTPIWVRSAQRFYPANGGVSGGGGRRGNVRRGTLIIPKSAIPYVARVINHWYRRVMGRMLNRWRTLYCGFRQCCGLAIALSPQKTLKP